jgi:hypothetical protein
MCFERLEEGGDFENLQFHKAVCIGPICLQDVEAVRFLDKELADVIENSVIDDYREFTDCYPILIVALPSGTYKVV